jgi:endogenous inhibitor of DNA gyrase (YacG/DUF329 family)
MTLEVNCPTCKRKVQWSDENKWRPFCSERCKLIDLGEWAAESHRIAGDPVIDPDNPDGDYH